MEREVRSGVQKAWVLLSILPLTGWSLQASVTAPVIWVGLMIQHIRSSLYQSSCPIPPEHMGRHFLAPPLPFGDPPAEPSLLGNSLCPTPSSALSFPSFLLAAMENQVLGEEGATGWKDLGSLNDCMEQRPHQAVLKWCQSEIKLWFKAQAKLQTQSHWDFGGERGGDLTY